MSDTESEIQSENPTPDADAGVTSAPQPEPGRTPDPDVATGKKCPIPGICRRGIHLPLILSIIAILLAGYAVTTSRSHAPATVVRNNSHFKTLNTTVNKLGSEIDRINDRLNELGQNVQTNKDNLVQARLQKLLLNIREIAAMAKAETRTKISEIEDMLDAMTSPDQKTGELPDEEQKATEPAEPETDAQKTTEGIAGEGQEVAAPPSETTTVKEQGPGDSPASNPATSPEDSEAPNTPRSAETF